MIRSIKLGAAIAVVLAIGAVGAAAAQAGALDVGAAPAWMTGTQGTGANQNKLTVTSSTGSLTLTTVKFGMSAFDITTTTPSVTHLTSTPTFGECLLGGLAASCNPGTCKFTLSGVGAPAFTFNVSITGCTSAFSITQGTCTLTIGSTSTTLEKIVFSSVAGSNPSHVLAVLEVRKIPVVGDPGCPPDLQQAGNTGDLSGTQTTKAFSDSGGVEGAQVSLVAT